MISLTNDDNYSLSALIAVLTVIGAASAAAVKVVPESVIAQVGTTARFNCTATNDEPVHWTAKPYGSNTEHDIYIGEKLLQEDYAKSGRFIVEVNSTLRRYDLVIKDIKQSDVGVYTCTDERGFGEKAFAELVVWDMLTCQEDQRRESYMGENVFGLDQDMISVTCRINYKGNIRPQFVWSAGGRKLNGTQGTESSIASSSLILVATTKLNGTNVTCEAVIRGNSDDDVGTGVLWISDTIEVKYAMLKKEVVEECPCVENSLICNPPCSYKLETVNDTQRCAVNYSVGTEVKWFHFYQSSVHCSESGSAHPIVDIVLTFALIGVIALFAGYFLKKRLEERGELETGPVFYLEQMTLQPNAEQPIY